MEYRDATPSVLLLHDGELADLAAVVESIGGIDRRGKPTELDRSQAWDVVVASAGRMLELHDHLPDTSAVRIAVLDGDSKTLRAMLKRVDTDLLVRQPVHPAAVRLLILHTLYRGPEKRRNTRVSMGASVRFRCGLRRRPALLAELSNRGCRLVVDPGAHRATQGRLISVLLPPEVSDDKRPLSLRGHVIRVSRAEAQNEEIAVLFEVLGERDRKRLASILAAYSQGPAILDDAAPRASRGLAKSGGAAAPRPAAREASRAAASQPAREEPATIDPAKEPCTERTPQPAAAAPEREDLGARERAEADESAAAERRVRDRQPMSRRIVALGDEAARVLIGRDLSVGGMRIDATPGLQTGDRLQVAVHVRADGQPLVVSAEVARDDGAEGMALRFLEVGPEASAYLEAMVSALPSIVESNRGAGVVVSEVIGRAG